MYVVSLTKALDPDLFRLFVICPADAQISTLIKPPVTIIELPSLQPDKSFSSGGLLSLARLIKANKIDIVHAHASLSGRIAAKLAGVKVIYTRHTPVEAVKTGSYKWRINKYINSLLADKVIGVSDYITKQLLAEGLPANKIRLIYNGIDVSHYQQATQANLVKKHYGLSDDTIVLTIIARLEEIKGHCYALEAFALLDHARYNMVMFIVGSGSQEGYLQELAADLGIESRVIFTGVMPDVRPVLGMSDIMLLPSLAEALGLVLLEAMSMGKPCIASNVGGIPEVIEDGCSGILVTPGDVRGLVNAIQILLDDPQLSLSMGQRGRELAKEIFDINKMASQVSKIYLEMLNN